MATEVWADGERYEPYVGRWSRLVAARLLAWLGPAAGGRWVDVGCGTGALTSTIRAATDPAAVLAVDRSPAFARHVRQRLTGPGVAVAVADATALPARDGWADAAVSGLVLNFVGDPAAAVAELARVCRPGGVAAAYVWDYADGMELMRLFWSAAAALDPAGDRLDEGRRFPLCRPEPLTRLFEGAGLTGVEVTGITVPTPFRDFDDYWTPFLGGQGAAPAYCAGLSEEHRGRLRERLRGAVPATGAFTLSARAWAVRGTVG